MLSTWRSPGDQSWSPFPKNGGGGVSVSLPLLNSSTYWMAIICKSFLTLFGKFWVNAPPQCFIWYFSIVTLYHRISRRWGGTRDHFSEEFFWRLASTLTPLDRTSCRVNICRICCIFMVKKKPKTFHTSEFPVCSFCQTWRFFTATSKQPLDYSKFVK